MKVHKVPKYSDKAVGDEKIVIDESKNWVFTSEEELYAHFSPQIKLLEEEFLAFHSDTDLHDDEIEGYEDFLNQTLDTPGEVWQDSTSIPGQIIHIYIRRIEPEKSNPFFIIALTHVVGRIPAFIYLHFPTTDNDLVANYQRGELIYDQNVDELRFAALEGDAIGEGDVLAVGLCQAMLQLRGASDIPKEDFKKFAHLRENTIEEADEIWRSSDLDGNILVTFIKEYHDEEPGDLTYIVVTQEEPTSNVHALLFSFPTKDINLVERYRHGDSLNSNGTSQESSH